MTGRSSLFAFSDFCAFLFFLLFVVFLFLLSIVIVFFVFSLLSFLFFPFLFLLGGGGAPSSHPSLGPMSGSRSARASSILGEAGFRNSEAKVRNPKGQSSKPNQARFRNHQGKVRNHRNLKRKLQLVRDAGGLGLAAGSMRWVMCGVVQRLAQALSTLKTQPQPRVSKFRPPGVSESTHPVPKFTEVPDPVFLLPSRPDLRHVVA